MKKFKFVLLAFMTTMMAFSFTACSDDDDVEELTVTGVTVNPTSLELKVGTTGSLTATVAPSNAAVTSVTWSTSDENVATVDKGVVTAVAEGAVPLRLQKMHRLSTKASTISICS